MCAHFSLFATPDQIADLLGLDFPPTAARYNIAPTQPVIGAVLRDDRRELREFRWGLIPQWSKEASVGARMINARSETILERPAFRNAILRRRCVIPASGFYEWREESAAPVADAGLFSDADLPPRPARKYKQPYFLGLKSGEPFGLAGIYDYWRNPEGELIRSCAVLTTVPNEVVAPLHDRMPVILRQGDVAAWIDPEGFGMKEIGPMFTPIPAAEMTVFRANPAMNDPRREGPDILPLEIRSSSTFIH